MGGEFESKLTLLFTNVSNNLEYKRLQIIKGPLGKYWKNFEIPIGKFPANHQLEIWANPEYSNYNSYSNIALDDIEFIFCSSSVNIVDQSLNCDFDNGFCSYISRFEEFFVPPTRPF
jgi:hypothetical protein